MSELMPGSVLDGDPTLSSSLSPIHFLSDTESPILTIRAVMCVDMYRWVDGWMDGWMDGRTDGWMDGCLDGCIDGWMHRWMDGWMDGGREGWMDGWESCALRFRTLT